MALKISQKQLTNRLLRSLNAADFALIARHLTPVTLEVMSVLEAPDVPIENVYFLESGMASVVSITDPKAEVEVGLIGCEGVSGLAVILAGDRSPHHTYMQATGSALSITSERFRVALAKSGSLRECFLRYANAFAIQVAETAGANARAKSDERLSRLILMANDRIMGDQIPLTHEFLAIMLGVRRAGVTEAMSSLERLGLIEKKRQGVFKVLDRDGLEKAAGVFYGVPEREYERIMAA